MPLYYKTHAYVFIGLIKKNACLCVNSWVERHCTQYDVMLVSYYEWKLWACVGVSSDGGHVAAVHGVSIASRMQRDISTSGFFRHVTCTIMYHLHNSGTDVHL